MPDYSILAALFLAGFVATYCWRFAAVLLVAKFDPDSEFLLWVRAVATALVAALVMRLVVAPAGLMAESLLGVRLTALALGVGGFWLFQRNVEAGVATAVGAMLAGQVLFS